MANSILPDIYQVAIEHNIEFSSRAVSGRPAEKRAICPFHTCTRHKKPEYHLYINTEKNTFNCFSCGAKGGVVKFIALLEDRSEIEVLENLKRQARGYKKRPRRKMHPAEKLNGFQMKSMGFTHFRGWAHFKKQWKHNPAYIQRTLDWVWEEWVAHRQYHLEMCYKYLLIGLMDGCYEWAINEIKKTSKQLGVDFLSMVMKVYSQPQRPAWAKKMKELAALWVYSTPEPQNKKEAATG